MRSCPVGDEGSLAKGGCISIKIASKIAEDTGLFPTFLDIGIDCLPTETHPHVN